MQYNECGVLEQVFEENFTCQFIRLMLHMAPIVFYQY